MTLNNRVTSSGTQWLINVYDVDCVIIGVNAAATLERCLTSVIKSNYSLGKIYIYYVDGGSSDQSLEIARGFPEVRVIALKPEFPTPGLGRNQGWKAGNSPYVQFLDSDTVLDSDWIYKAVKAMDDPDVGAVRGNRRELQPQATIFNWLADLEWNAPQGECDAFGGDVLIRRRVLENTGGYDEILVGGEDPELSQRLRLQGHKIIQLNEPMTLHDIAMTTISQYWRRAYRTGYGFAAVTWRHARKTKGFWFHEFARIILRGGGFLGGTAIAFLGNLGDLRSAILLIISFTLLFYPRLFRTSHIMTAKGLPYIQARQYAWHCSLIVIPEFFGIVRFFYGEFCHKPLRNKSKRLKTSHLS